MYKINQPKKLLALSAIAAGLMAWGSAQAVITYYDMTFATNVNITGGGFNQTTGTPYGSTALFSTDLNKQVVGTGVIDPFIRIQTTSNNTTAPVNGANCGGNINDPCIEFGYNTSGNPEANGQVSMDMQFQEKDNQGTNWNQTIDKNSLTTVNIGGKEYYQFLLDINELTGEGILGGTAADKYLSLDQLRFFTNTGDNLEGYCYQGTVTEAGGGGYLPATHTLGDADCKAAGNPGATNTSLKTVFDMDLNAAGTIDDKSIALDYSVNSGSGLGRDLLVSIEASLFTGDKIYLFSSFGEMGLQDGKTQSANAGLIPQGNYFQSDGFEEWATFSRTPVPATLALLLAGLGGLAGIRKLTPRVRFA